MIRANAWISNEDYEKCLRLGDDPEGLYEATVEGVRVDIDPAAQAAPV